MPAPVLAAGAAIAPAVLQSRSANKATDAQERATKEALALERERDAAAARQHAERQARLAPFRMGAVGLLQKYYGPDFYQQSQEFGAAPTPGPTAQPRSLAQLALGSVPGTEMQRYALPELPGEPMAGEPKTWQDWRR